MSKEAWDTFATLCYEISELDPTVAICKFK